MIWYILDDFITNVDYGKFIYKLVSKKEKIYIFLFLFISFAAFLWLYFNKYYFYFVVFTLIFFSISILFNFHINKMIKTRYGNKLNFYTVRIDELIKILKSYNVNTIQQIELLLNSIDEDDVNSLKISTQFNIIFEIIFLLIVPVLLGLSSLIFGIIPHTDENIRTIILISVSPWFISGIILMLKSLSTTILDKNYYCMKELKNMLYDIILSGKM